MHPVLFQLPTPFGTQPVYAYGVMLGLSLLLGFVLVMALGRRAALSRDLLGDVYLTASITGIVGARLLYVATNLEEVGSPAEWLDLRGGGLVAYGGFISGFLGALVHLRIKRGALLAFADPAAPAIGLGLFFTRIGCYLYGCDFGTRLSADAPQWLASLGTFPRWADGELRGSPAFLHHVSVYNLPHDALHSYPVHPTQLYEALVGIALFALSLSVLRKRTFDGQAFLLLTILYGVLRFLLESLRDDPERGLAYGFSTSQLVSLALVPIAAIAYSLLARRARAAQLHASPHARS